MVFLLAQLGLHGQGTLATRCKIHGSCYIKVFSHSDYCFHVYFTLDLSFCYSGNLEHVEVVGTQFVVDIGTVVPGIGQQ